MTTKMMMMYDDNFDLEQMVINFALDHVVIVVVVVVDYVNDDDYVVVVVVVE